MGLPRWAIAVAVLALSIVLPLGLVLALALAPADSALELALLALATGSWMALLALVNWWEFTALGLRWAWVTALALAALLRTLGAPGGAALGTTGAIALALAVAGLALLARAIAARRPAGESVELRLPFAGGRFLVTDGGDGAKSFLVNYHYGFGTHRASGVSASMRYAMDVVEIGATGRSVRGFLPLENAAWRIWERPLLAPCDGRVEHVVNDVPDNDAFGANRPYGVGNHVVIRHGEDAIVVLGHLRTGSVMVAPGESVRVGQPIAKAGNSGWTERPHLHVQAMRCAGRDWWHGEPLAMRFGGRFLVRNDVARVSERA